MSWTEAKSEMCTCHQCGKEFFIPIVSEWAYKKLPSTIIRTTKYFCSWGCMRKYEKYEEEEQIKRYGRKMRHEIKHG